MKCPIRICGVHAKCGSIQIECGAKMKLEDKIQIRLLLKPQSSAHFYANMVSTFPFSVKFS